MAAPGTLTITVFDASRQPWHGPRVRLVLTDPFSDSSNKVLLDREMAQGTNQIVLNEIPADAGQNYIIFLDADGHRGHHVFPVKPRPGVDLPLNVMLIPNDPEPNFAKFDFEKLKLKSPQFHKALTKHISESDFFGLQEGDVEFGAIRMATVLNIEAKLRNTALKTGKAADFIEEVANLAACERDRIKVDVRDDMLANVKGLKTFQELNELFNESQHKGFPISFKEKLPFCSLQLSFAKTVSNHLRAADIDIDLLTDIGHFTEVIKNKITQTKTDAFSIYVLLFDQGIHPLYTVKV